MRVEILVIRHGRAKLPLSRKRRFGRDLSMRLGGSLVLPGDFPSLDRSALQRINPLPLRVVQAQILAREELRH
jgi:hypothetical protein